MTLRLSSLLAVTATAAAFAGCIDVEEPAEGEGEQEVITTVTLTFTPVGGGAALVFSHADPENDGAPVIEPIALAAETTYDLAVQFKNELSDPAEDITAEVADESDEHQVFVYGSGVEGPATGDNDNALVTVAYDDTDANELPVGLDHSVVAAAAGTAEFKLMLRHLPEEDDVAVKVEGLAGDFAEGGSSAIGGDVDADVTFPLTVE